MATTVRKPYTRQIQPHPCEHCGGETQRPRFCSVRCSRLARDRRQGMRTWAERYPTTRTQERDCIVCGHAFTRRQKSTDATLCCSRECGFELLRMRGEVSRRITAEKRLYAKWSKRAHSVPRLVSSPKGKAVKKCRDCHAQVPKGKQRCQSCKDAARRRAKHKAMFSEAAKAAKRAAKARRRAIERGAGAERFDPFEIFDRDGWRCHLCGCKTPKRLRGTYEDNAPELDHLVPLAAGGEHTRLNTACSCRKCNGQKADKPLGQLRLVA